MTVTTQEAQPLPSGTLLIRDIKILPTQNEELGEIADAAIYVSGNQIQWVGRTSDLPHDLQQADKVISLPDHAVLPGLINTHNHMYGSLTRCAAQGSGLFEWLGVCAKSRAAVTSHDAYVAAKLVMAELILGGCTTSVDHMLSYPNDVKMDDSIRAAREIGMRFHAARGTQSINLGGAPAALYEDEDVALAEMERTIQQFHDNTKFAMVRVAVAPSIPFVVSRDMMVRARQLAERYPGVRLHTHFMESDNDAVLVARREGVPPHEFMKQVGWDSDRVWCAHCCKVDEEAADMFAAAGMGVAHCPSSNARLANGIAPVRMLLDKGVNVGLGTDGPSANDANNLLAEMRQAMFLQRLGGNAKGLSAREALKLGTKGGARNLGRDDIGEIAPGKAADFVAWNIDVPSFCGSTDLVAALVFCSPGLGPVQLAVINGRVIVEAGRFCDMDLKALMVEHDKCAARVNLNLTSAAS